MAWLRQRQMTNEQWKMNNETASKFLLERLFYLVKEGNGVFGPYMPRSLFKPAGCEDEFSLSRFLSGHVAGYVTGNVVCLVKIALPTQPASQTGDNSEQFYGLNGLCHVHVESGGE
jgi:hypothetical protein